MVDLDRELDPEKPYVPAGTVPEGAKVSKQSRHGPEEGLWVKRAQKRVKTGVLDANLVAGFSAKVLQARYDEPVPIPTFHREIWELACLPDPQVAIAAPRGHAKSTALTFAFAITGLLFKEFRHLLIISANESLASDLVQEIANEFHANDLLVEGFGPFKFHAESSTELIIETREGNAFRVLAKGAGQRMRGLKWRATRPDMVLCDDLEDDEIVLNAERREKFRRWFYGAVRPLVRAGGRIRLYGTIIHMDSLLERAMPSLKDPGVVSTPLKIEGKFRKGWKSVKYRAHTEDFSQILWPGRFNEAQLRSIRDEYVQMGLADVYGQEYLNDPIDEASAYFRRSDLLPMPDEARATRKTYYCGVDFAISKETKADYTAMAVGGVDLSKKLHVVDIRKGRWDSFEIVNEIFSLHERYDCYFRFEADKIEKALRPILEAEMVKRQQFLNFDVKAPTKDKLQRARAFQFRTRAGNVTFDTTADWWADAESELTRFPKAPHDDVVDALAWLGDLVAEELTPATDSELADEAWFAEYGATADRGASAVTGY